MEKPSDPRAGYIAIASAKFSVAGYHGTSLAALAREAGVTKQALLHFFGTKERLYSEVLTDLAARLCAEIDAAARPDPADHLRAYFADFLTVVRDRPDDARLVVRALLDSDAQARVWPMKPYLDRLIALARQTPGGRDASQAEMLAMIIQTIGAIQYFAVSIPALSGMYGSAVVDTVAARFDQIIADALHALSAPATIADE